MRFCDTGYCSVHFYGSRCSVFGRETFSQPKTKHMVYLYSGTFRKNLKKKNTETYTIRDFGSESQRNLMWLPWFFFSSQSRNRLEKRQNKIAHIQNLSISLLWNTYRIVKLLPFSRSSQLAHTVLCTLLYFLTFFEHKKHTWAFN